jgi:glutamine cyclotransferase
MRHFTLSLAILIGGALSASAQPACPAPRQMGFETRARINLSVRGFTEGLEKHGPDLYESTGPIGGNTRLLRIAPDGHVTVINDVGRKYFGEGLTFLGDHAYQLSWQDHQVFVYDQNFKVMRAMANPQEGWGLTNDGHELIFSDGSAHLFFADPANFRVTRRVDVRRIDQPIDQVNELEYVDGQVYANIWLTRMIVRINPQNGCIDGEADMSPLWQQMNLADQYQIQSNNDAVLNGIAYDPGQKLFYVTGKEWPMIFAGRFTGG